MMRRRHALLAVALVLASAGCALLAGVGDGHLASPDDAGGDEPRPDARDDGPPGIAPDAGDAGAQDDGRAPFGPPLLVADAQKGPHGIVTDPQHIYWVATSEGAIRMALKPPDGGGGSGTIVVDQLGVGVVTDLRADDVALFWATTTDLETVAKPAPAPGAPARSLLTTSQIFDVRVAGVALVFAATDSTFGPKYVGSISKRGDAGPLIYSGSPSDQPSPLAADETRVFWYDGALYASAGGGLRVKIADAAPVLDMALDATSLFFTTETGLVARLDRSPAGAAVVPLASGESGPVKMALDRDYVYWAAAGDGTIKRVAKAGGRATVIAADQLVLYGIAVDDDGVYWTTTTSGTVMMAPRLR